MNGRGQGNATIKRNKKNRFLYLSTLLSLFSLAFSLINPILAANGAAITKTFTIRGADNALLVGAKIRMFWFDPSTRFDGFSEVVTTNDQGIAAVTVNVETTSLTYVVAPPDGDIANAMTAQIPTDNKISENLNVTLQAANMVVEILSQNGSSVSASDLVAISYPRSQSINDSAVSPILRSGPVGIKIFNSLSTSSNYGLFVGQRGFFWGSGRLSWRYGLKASGSAGAQTHTVYEDQSYNQVLEPTNNIYRLSFKAGNLSGFLRASNGDEINILSGTYGNININPVGVVDTLQQYSSSYGLRAESSPQGQFYAQLNGPAGRYLMRVQFANSSTFPNFYTYIWKNSEGKFSTTENGTYVNSGLEILMPPANSINFKIKIVSPEDNTAVLPSTYFVLDKDKSEVVFGSRAIAGEGMGYLPDGNYSLNLQPNNQDYLLTTYSISVVGGALTVSDSNNQPVAANNDGIYIVKPLRPNLSGILNVPAGIDTLAEGPLTLSGSQNVNLQLQKWSAGTSSWNYVNGTSLSGLTGASSVYRFSVTDLGKYRVEAQPAGLPELARTYSDVMELYSDGDVKKLRVLDDGVNDLSPGIGALNLSSDITFRKSNARFKLLDPTNDSLLSFSQVQIFRKNLVDSFEWISGLGVNGGFFGDQFIDGEYQLVVSAPQTPGLGQKTYSLEVSNSGVTIVLKSGNVVINPADGFYTLKPATANVTGKVVNQEGVPYGLLNGVWINVQLQKFTPATNRWEWVNNWSQVGQQGFFSMSVNELGKYRVRIEPNGIPNVAVTNSDEFEITADNISTFTKSFGNMQLSAPTWSGTVRAPLGLVDEVVPYANVCLNTGTEFNCTNANAQGEWALSASPGFTSFATNASLQVQDVRGGVHPMLLINGGTAVSEALGGLSGSNRVLRFKSANLNVTVKEPGGANLAGAWLNIDADNVGWLGNGRTDADGVAKISIDQSRLSAGSNLNIRVEVNSATGGASLAPALKRLQIDSDLITTLGAGTKEITVNLEEPNFRGVLNLPTVGGVPGAVAPNSWIELFEETDSGSVWKGGASTNPAGKFNLNLEKPDSGSKEYTLVANPPWNSTGSEARKSYTVNVTSSNVVTAFLKGTATALGTTTIDGTAYYALKLASPSASGLVVKPDLTPVQNSWVVPSVVLTGETLWQQGVNSRGDGSFALALNDGAYRLEANAPWNTSDFSRSAQCAITIENGAITTPAAGCVQNDGTVKLALRAPNITLTLKKPDQTTNVAFANVGVCVLNWCTNAQSGEDGKVSLFLDKAAIKARNSQASGLVDFNLWLDPPYRSSEIVRGSCTSRQAGTICATLQSVNLGTTDEYPTINLGNYVFSEPNTKVRIMSPSNAQAISNSWVELFEFDPANNASRWLAGAPSDASGWAAFNVDSATAIAGVNTRYKLRVNSPWDSRAQYSSKWHGNDNFGLQLSEVHNQSFVLAAPNLVVKVKAPGGTEASRFGWLGVEEIDANNNYVRWIDGVGFSQLGIASLTLESSKRFRLFANPNSGALGARTDCIISTNAEAVISLVSCAAGSLNATPNPDELSITLNSGNVVGTVKNHLNFEVAGAFIYANVAGATNEDFAVTTVTDVNGRFGLQLDTAKTWSIKILPLNAAGSTALKNKALDPFTPPGTGTLELGTIQLEAK